MKINFSKLNLITIDQQLFISKFFGYLTSLKLNGYIKLANTDCIDFSVVEYDGTVTITCNLFKYQKQIQADESGVDLFDKLLEMCGIGKTIVSGFTVKDQNGNKIKPEIKIFKRQKLEFLILNELHYVKTPVIGKELTNKCEVHFDSEILTSLLSEAPMFFTNNEQLFKIVQEKHGNYLYYNNKPSTAVDFVTGHTILHQLKHHMKVAEKYKIFYDFTSFRFNSTVFNKHFYKEILCDYKNQDHLVDFLMHAPRFQDERDVVIRNLKDMAIEHFQAEFMQKAEYLEVYKNKKLKNKNAYSLDKFENP